MIAATPSISILLLAMAASAAVGVQPRNPLSADPQSTAGRTPGASSVMLPGSRPLTTNDLERVTMGPGNVSSLGVTGRVGQANLRVQNDFSGLYRIPETAHTKYAGWYAREQGGVMAVFPQSQYTQDGDGNIIVPVPAGTVFLVGGIPQDDSRRSETLRPENGQIDRRQYTSIGAQPPAEANKPHDGGDRPRLVATPPARLAAIRQGTIEAIVTDDDFAAKRIALRLEQALDIKPTLVEPARLSPAPKRTQVPAPPAAKPASTPVAANGWTLRAPAEKPSPQPPKPESK